MCVRAVKRDFKLERAINEWHAQKVRAGHVTDRKPVFLVSFYISGLKKHDITINTIRDIEAEWHNYTQI